MIYAILICWVVSMVLAAQALSRSQRKIERLEAAIKDIDESRTNP